MSPSCSSAAPGTRGAAGVDGVGRRRRSSASVAARRRRPRASPALVGPARRSRRARSRCSARSRTRSLLVSLVRRRVGPGLRLPTCVRCSRDCFFGCWRAAGRRSTAPAPAAASDRGGHRGRAVARLGGVPLRLRLRGRRAGRRVVADDVELLAHRPQVRRGPVEEDADRERDATDGEDERAARRAASSAAGRRAR